MDMDSSSPIIIDDGPAWVGPRPFIRSTDKKYFKTSINHRSAFAKQSLRPEEMRPNVENPELLARQCAARLRNEAAAIAFMSRNTRIPVPTVLAYHDDGQTVALATGTVPGIQMRSLPEQQSRAEVSRQLDDMVLEMREITRGEATGFAGLLCLHPMVYASASREPVPPVPAGSDIAYPLCHGDLTGSNVIVNPETNTINAIIDWEYSGFYPPIMDFPYYQVAVETPRRMDAGIYPSGYLAACRWERRRLASRVSIS